MTNGKLQQGLSDTWANSTRPSVGLAPFLIIGRFPLEARSDRESGRDGTRRRERGGTRPTTKGRWAEPGLRPIAYVASMSGKGDGRASRPLAMPTGRSAALAWWPPVRPGPREGWEPYGALGHMPAGEPDMRRARRQREQFGRQHSWAKRLHRSPCWADRAGLRESGPLSTDPSAPERGHARA